MQREPILCIGGPWEQLIAQGTNDEERAEMLSWNRAWLIDRRSGALADAFPCRIGMTACSIRAWPLRVAVHNPASRGEHACGRACGRACVVCALLALGGIASCARRAACV